MDSWNQEGMFSNNQGQRMMLHQQQSAQRPTMTSYNANLPQGFYRPRNPQQFYMNPGVHPGHLGYQPNQVYSERMNPSPQQFMSAGAPSQSMKQMTQAEQNELRKKKNFEEQQRRLLSLKQRGPGHTQKTQMDNPLDNLFGNKGSSSNASSLLGSLGNASKPKDNPVFQGSVTSGQTTIGFSAASAGYHSSSLPDVTNTSPSLQNTTLTGPYISAPTNTLSRPGNLENLHSFAKVKNVEDDFGDFQQSQADLSFGNIEKPVELTPPSNSTAAATSVSQSLPVMHNSASVLDSRVGFRDGKTSEEPSVVQDTAAPTPSIEELMKNSLILDKQSQSPVRKFQKPKLPKLIKSQPSHFSESAKASKWNNDLESLSEMFTIPQPAVAQPEPACDYQSHGITNSSDDWADFVGTSDQSGAAVFQEQANQGLVQGSFDHMPATSGQDGMQGNEVLFGVSSGFSGTQLGQSGVAWKPATQAWPDVGVMMPKMQNLTMAQDTTEGIENIIGSEVVPEQTHGTGLENKGVPLQDVVQESLDPEKQLYGVRLPGWSKDTTLLPAVYKQIYQICSSDSTDISTSQLYPILLSSDLPRDKLGHIWSQCNKAVPGQLNEQELYLILGMIALAQVGLQINKLTLEKLASCITAPIPSFPENIFQSQNDSDTVSSVLPAQTNTSFNNELESKHVESSITGDLSGPPADNNLLTNPPYTNIDVVKQPDWSKWKTSKAAHVDDKFADFQMIVPKDQLPTFKRPDSSTLPNLNFANSPVTSTSNSVDTFGSFQNSGLTVQASLTDRQESTTKPLDNSVHLTVLSDSSSKSTELQKVGGDSNSHSMLPEFQSFSSADTSSNTGNGFRDFASASYSVPEIHVNVADQNKTAPLASVQLMSVPLQASQRYALTGEDETIDYHEKAWLKCVTSCFAVIMKSCQILQSITDPYLFEELFSSPQGISHFSAIIEIYCVSQRVKASVMKSAPNNKKLKESLQNIENVWNICLGFQSFKALLPLQCMNFSGCHVNENEDLNLTCGVCLLNVDKSWVNSSVNKGQSGKLSYGSRYYHTTCANFWCNKVDSVLPALQLNVGNSLI